MFPKGLGEECLKGVLLASDRGLQSRQGAMRQYISRLKGLPSVIRITAGIFVFLLLLLMLSWIEVVYVI